MTKRGTADLIEALLAPAQAVLTAVDPAAAKDKRARMRRSPLAFYRATLALQLPALVAQAGGDGPWVWAVGDPHLENFATLATGPERAGGPRVVFDLADGDDEHPAPWAWDLLRFVASVAVARPRLDRAEVRDLARRTFARYREVVERGAEDDLEHGARIFVQDLPPSVVALMERDGDPRARQAWLKQTVARGRLRRGAALRDDVEAKRSVLPALAAAFDAMPQAPRLVDLCRRDDSGVSSLGRRRWLALALGPGAGAVRTIEVKERRPSELARVVPALPDHGLPARGVAVTVPLGGDPYQVVLPGAAWPLLARTRCHARTPLVPADLDGDELPALVRLCATLIARFHLRGLELCGVAMAKRAGAIAGDVRRRGDDLGRVAWELAKDNRHAFAAWKEIS